MMTSAENFQPGISTDLPGPATDLPGPATDLPGPATDLPGPAPDLPGSTAENFHHPLDTADNENTNQNVVETSDNVGLLILTYT